MSPIAPMLISRVRELRRITGGSRNCGWMSDEQAFLLYALIKRFRPEVVLQTGHLWGKSALVIAEALDDGFLMEENVMEDEKQEAHVVYSAFVASNTPKPTKGILISIDPLPRNVPDWRAGVEYIRSHHPSFVFHQMLSTEYFLRVRNGTLPSPKGKRLMGIVDGDHSYLGCLIDIRNFHNLGADIIIVDDTSWIPFTRRACERFARRNGYSFCHLPDYNGLGILARMPRKKPSAPSAQTPFFSHVSDWTDAIAGEWAVRPVTLVTMKIWAVIRRTWRLGIGGLRRIRRYFS